MTGAHPWSGSGTHAPTATAADSAAISRSVGRRPDHLRQRIAEGADCRQLQLRRNYHRRRHRQFWIVIADYDRRRHDLVLRQLGQSAFGGVQLVAVAAAATAASARVGHRQRQVWADIGRQANHLLLDLVLVLKRPVAGPDEQANRQHMDDKGIHKRIFALRIQPLTRAK